MYLIYLQSAVSCENSVDFIPEWCNRHLRKTLYGFKFTQIPNPPTPFPAREGGKLSLSTRKRFAFMERDLFLFGRCLMYKSAIG